MPIAFQPNAFQVDYPGELSAFQGADIFVSVALVESFPFLEIFLNLLGGSMLEYQAGSAIVIRATIRDPSLLPSPLIDPLLVTLDIIDPLNDVIVSSQQMDRYSTGIYQYTFQSDEILSESGAYRVSVKAVSGSYTSETIPQIAFVIV